MSLYALPSADSPPHTPERPVERLFSLDHPNGFGYCQLCRGQVQSRLINTVWQWVHVSPCTRKPRPRKARNDRP